MCVNKRLKFISGAAVFLLLFVPVPGFSDSMDGSGRFMEIRDLYIKWDQALFGSGPSCRRELYQFCLDSIDSEIVTDADFCSVFPEKNGEAVECRFKFAGTGWLRIHGVPDAESMEKMSRLKGDFQRSLNFYRIKGILKKFRLGQNQAGKTVDLWLDKVVLY